MIMIPTGNVNNPYVLTDDKENPLSFDFLVTVEDNGTVLTKDKDYTAALTSNINAGTAKITVKKINGANYSFVAGL